MAVSERPLPEVHSTGRDSLQAVTQGEKDTAEQDNRLVINID
jgi:hypothetical protein